LKQKLSRDGAKRHEINVSFVYGLG